MCGWSDEIYDGDGEKEGMREVGRLVSWIFTTLLSKLPSEGGGEGL